MRGCRLLLLVLLLGGCAGGVSIRHYLIDPVPGPALAVGDRPAIEIIDVQLPRYLDRNQLVRRGPGGELVLAGGHQWGESLRLNLMRTLATNLGTRLPTAEVTTPRMRLARPADYRLLVAIVTFEPDAGGTVHLDARWQVLAGDGSGTLLSEHTRLRAPDGVDAREPGTQVAVMGRLFARLSDEIADALRDLADEARGES